LALARLGAGSTWRWRDSARDAMMLDYRVIMLADANATLSDDEHAATLNNFAMFFGDVMTAGEATDRLIPAPSRKTN
jgi:ureidoacrylate peracid hydrolase